MIICLCHGLNSSRLEQLTAQGLTSVRQLQQACKAGTTCGACLPELKKACAYSYAETSDTLEALES